VKVEVAPPTIIFSSKIAVPVSTLSPWVNKRSVADNPPANVDVPVVSDSRVPVIVIEVAEMLVEERSGIVEVPDPLTVIFPEERTSPPTSNPWDKRILVTSIPPMKVEVEPPDTKSSLRSARPLTSMFPAKVEVEFAS